MGGDRTGMGLDISLAGTGLAVWQRSTLEQTTIKTSTADGDLVERTDFVIRMVRSAIRRFRPDLIAVEAPAFHPVRGMDTRGLEVAGAVKWYLHHQQHAYVLVGTGTLKKFATGKGNADKKAMVAAAQLLVPELKDHNQADALFLAKYAAEHYDELVVESDV